MPDQHSTLHGATLPSEPAWERLLARGPRLPGEGSDPPLTSPPLAIALTDEARDVVGPAGADGPAAVEALAARLEALGLPLARGAPVSVTSSEELLEAYRAWGAGAVRTVRADPRALSRLALGALVERRAPASARRARLGRRDPASDAARAFWEGVRAEATPEELAWLTSRYTVLLYHRLAGESKPGQERLDVSPGAFDRQLRLLRTLRCHVLGEADLVSFHAGPPHGLPRRSVLVTVDDAFADVVEPLRRHGALHPHLFVPTGAVGGRASWLDGERVATWGQLETLVAAGVGLGAHSRSHPDLRSLEAAAAEREIDGAADDLQRALGARPESFAYPMGRSGPRERDLVAASGYVLAFATTTGRNGPGTDRYALNRVSVKDWDTRLSFAWKALTGTQPPAAWERWLTRRSGTRRRPGPALRATVAAARGSVQRLAARRRRDRS